mmetsp:Transcript_21824/g.35128  ORF Transcript_21824/g.35128 Transcript_21824/m.35128 type:complete len:97 (+) Transcript_21824:395-685(+)
MRMLMLSTTTAAIYFFLYHRFSTSKLCLASRMQLSPCKAESTNRRKHATVGHSNRHDEICGVLKNEVQHQPEPNFLRKGEVLAPPHRRRPHRSQKT